MRMSTGLVGVLALGVIVISAGCEAHKQPTHTVKIVAIGTSKLSEIDASRYADPETGCLAILFDGNKKTVCPKAP